MTAPLVLVLYNHPSLPGDHPDADSEHSVVDIALRMAEILEADGGFRSAALGVSSKTPRYCWTELRRRKPAVVFNLFEGNLDNADSESYVAGLLEWRGVPFTGSPMHTLSLARGKHLAKPLFRGAGLPTADFMVVSELPCPPCNLEWPVIVKPAQQDASVGLDQESVCVINASSISACSISWKPMGRRSSSRSSSTAGSSTSPCSSFPSLNTCRRRRSSFRKARPAFGPSSRTMGSGIPAPTTTKRRRPNILPTSRRAWHERLGTIADACLSPPGLPGLRPRRFPREAQRQAVHPGSESQSGDQRSRRIRGLPGISQYSL